MLIWSNAYLTRARTVRRIGAYMVYAGTVGSGVILADDVTVIGVADDPLLVVTGGIGIIGGVLIWFGL